MSEYWKSTPKYWCKHCSLYVRDTKLDRTNHEATGKHKGAVERALRDLHRGHEREEREKDRAKREIERLNSVVSGTPGSSSSATTRPNGAAQPPARTAAPAQLTKDQRQAQLEQLAALGVNLPDEVRAEMAMVGEWTVTKTRVVDETGKSAPGARATGIRKRELEKTEEEKEEEDAVKGLFKKQRRWGRDSRLMPNQEDAELDALLSGNTFAKKEDVKTETKIEDDGEAGSQKVKTEERIKHEDGAAPVDAAATAPSSLADKVKREELPVKQEEEEGEQSAPVDKTLPARTEPEAAGATAAPAVVFKKRKPKNIRQK